MAEQERRLHYGIVIVSMGVLVVFGSLGLARFGYSTLVPSMQNALKMDNTQAGLLATANLAGYLLLSVIGGALASHYGPRRVIAAGLTLAGVGMVMTGLARSLTGVTLWRAVTGIGSGASNVPVVALLVAWFAPSRRGLASGIVVAGSSLALILLGPVVPRLLTMFGDSGWRVCWFLFGGVTMALALAALYVLRDRPAELGLTPIGSKEKITNRKPEEPSGWHHVYRSKVVWHLAGVYTAFGFSYIIYLTFFVKLLTAEAGYTQVSAGRLFMVMGWFSLLCGLIWGPVSDKIGRQWAMAIVYLIQAMAFGLFAVENSPACFTVSAVLFGLTAWSIPAIMGAACGDVLGAKMAPAGLGFVTFFFGIGQALGPSAAGAMSDASGSLSSSMALAAAVAFLGAIGAALLPQKLVGCVQTELVK